MSQTTPFKISKEVCSKDTTSNKRSGDTIKKARTSYHSRLLLCAEGGTRTPTVIAYRRILSPLRLPFRHFG